MRVGHDPTISGVTGQYLDRLDLRTALSAGYQLPPSRCQSPLAIHFEDIRISHLVPAEGLEPPTRSM